MIDYEDDDVFYEVNHTEALQLASLKRKDSNLARCYLELARINQSLSERLGLFGPFITGMSKNVSKNGMPMDIYVCPHYGLDGIAKYRLIQDYDTLIRP